MMSNNEYKHLTGEELKLIEIAVREKLERANNEMDEIEKLKDSLTKEALRYENRNLRRELKKLWYKADTLALSHSWTGLDI